MKRKQKKSAKETGEENFKIPEGSRHVLEGYPVDFGFSLGQFGQLLLDGSLPLQKIVFLLQVRYALRTRNASLMEHST